MSLDLHQRETMEVVSRLRPETTLEPDTFDNFLSGTGRIAMRGAAETARMASMAVGGAIAGIEQLGQFHPLQPRLDTSLSDRWFRQHDEIFQSAVDYWTPKRNEVGVAAEVVGTLLSTLPLILASPATAVAKHQLTTAEDLLRKGVSAEKAGAVGAVQGAGLGLGIWLPILGRNLWERAVIGGAGFNIEQGIITRGISGSILEGTKAAEDFKAFDWSMITIDGLLGLAFGGFSHLSPAQRAQGEAAWKRIHDWVTTFKPTDLDALAVLRQGEHIEVDSLPGKPVETMDVDRHVERMRTSIDQLSRDEPVQVDHLPPARFEVDPARETFGSFLEGQFAAAADEFKSRFSTLTPEQAAAIQRDRQAQTISVEDHARIEAIKDPLERAAERFAAERPDLQLYAGQDAEGNRLYKTPRQLLDDTRRAAQHAQEDARLFQVAAECMLGIA